VAALLSLWSWLAIVLVVIVGFFLQLALAILTLPFDRRRVVAGRFFRLMAVTCAKLIPTWHFATVSPFPRRLPGKTIVVSNHVSHADAFLISHLPWEMKWLAKKSLFYLPLMGWSMWLAGDVPVARGKRTSAADAMARCAAWLERGQPVMIFPEGTRSKDGALQSFKDGAFRLALDTGAEILPIAVDGTQPALPKHSWRFGRSHARVAVGTPISPAGKTVGELKEAVRAQIESIKARLPAP
jgi:1-acyl-sn-glycerol-3-phosphate acyltransferase